jgi:hypothetical protein
VAVQVCVVILQGENCVLKPTVSVRVRWDPASNGDDDDDDLIFWLVATNHSTTVAVVATSFWAPFFLVVEW